MTYSGLTSLSPVVLGRHLRDQPGQVWLRSPRAQGIQPCGCVAYHLSHVAGSVLLSTCGPGTAGCSVSAAVSFVTIALSFISSNNMDDLSGVVGWLQEQVMICPIRPWEELGVDCKLWCRPTRILSKKQGCTATPSRAHDLP
eukprot:scaffold129442_cov33-Tisochrysis_lutea.AAC.1